MLDKSGFVIESETIASIFNCLLYNAIVTVGDLFEASDAHFIKNVVCNFYIYIRVIIVFKLIQIISGVVNLSHAFLLDWINLGYQNW